MAIHLVIGALLILPVVARGGTDGDSPLPTSICELVKSPPAFNGRIVSVRAPVQIAFEKFGLSVDECADKKLDYVALEYGSGPKKPTTWCCGDLAPRDALTLTQDAEFRRFHRFLTAEKKAPDCYNCYLFHVTATITGRFDAVDTQPCPGDVTGHCCSGGFSHFGATCARIVIRSVSRVVATPIDPTIYDRKR